MISVIGPVKKQTSQQLQELERQPMRFRWLQWDSYFGSKRFSFNGPDQMARSSVYVSGRVQDANRIEFQYDDKNTSTCQTFAQVSLQLEGCDGRANVLEGELLMRVFWFLFAYPIIAWAIFSGTRHFFEMDLRISLAFLLTYLLGLFSRNAVIGHPGRTFLEALLHHVILLIFFAISLLFVFIFSFEQLPAFADLSSDPRTSLRQSVILCIETFAFKHGSAATISLARSSMIVGLPYIGYFVFKASDKYTDLDEHHFDYSSEVTGSYIASVDSSSTKQPPDLVTLASLGLKCLEVIFAVMGFWFAIAWWRDPDGNYEPTLALIAAFLLLIQLLSQFLKRLR